MKVTFKPAPGKSVSVSLSTNSASTTFPLTAGVVRLVSTVDCFIRFGYQSATATTASMFLPGATPEYFNLDGADTIAGIVASGTGTLYVSEMM